jgi:hypothetical protein
VKLLVAIFLLLAVGFCDAQDTNRFHLTLTWDTVSKAQWYALIVRSNGVETQRRWSMTNSVVVSNLIGNLDCYQFTAIATNQLFVSDESPPAQKTWAGVQVSSNLLTWVNWFPSDNTSQDPRTNNWLYLRITNWNAVFYLKRD